MSEMFLFFFFFTYSFISQTFMKHCVKEYKGHDFPQGAYSLAGETEKQSKDHKKKFQNYDKHMHIM